MRVFGQPGVGAAMFSLRVAVRSRGVRRPVLLVH